MVLQTYALRIEERPFLSKIVHMMQIISKCLANLFSFPRPLLPHFGMRETMGHFIRCQWRSLASRRKRLTMAERIGLIAGNGTFPLLLLDAARAQGFDVIVAAIKEEASQEIEAHGAAAVHWLSLGELSKLIETFHREGVRRAIMAGQVKHKQIFSSIRPDWRLAKLLLSLGTRNTDSLLGAVARTLADEGIALENSTAFLEPLLGRFRSLDHARTHSGRKEKH